MKEMIQLAFIEDPPEIRMQREINALKEHVDKVRKSQYAKLGKLTKMYEEIKREHEEFKATLCRKPND